MFCNEYRTNFMIFASFSYRDMVDFVLNILSEMETLTTASVTVCEPDSKTLTSDTR